MHMKILSLVISMHCNFSIYNYIYACGTFFIHGYTYSYETSIFNYIYAYDTFQWKK